MTIELPPAIARYFAADSTRDADAVSKRFTTNAVVKDVGEEHTGRDAIRQWMTEAYEKYTATTEPFEMKEQDGATVVTSHLVGNFPGSPIDLRYRFVVDGELISNLEITL